MIVSVTDTSLWINTLNPFVLRFPESWGLGEMGVRWYGLAYLTGFLLGGWLVAWLSRRGKILVSVDQISDLVTYVALGTMIGGRLGYCLFYQPQLFWTFRSQLPFWDVLAVHEGGMASHGGIAGIMLACWLFARKYQLPTMHLIDLATLGGAIGIFFGRIANFINGELVGREAPAGTWWAVKFPTDMANWSLVTPGGGVPQQAQLELLTPAVEKLGVKAVQWADWVKLMRYDVQAEQGVRETLQRLIAATQNGDRAIAEALGPALTARYPSQLIEAGLEGLLVFCVLLWVWRKPRKPGVVAGIFGVVYASVRIIGEQFRLPDAHIGFQALGLTRGQWISFGMLALAVVLLWIWSRRDAAKLGGWWQGSLGPRPSRS